MATTAKPEATVTVIMNQSLVGPKTAVHKNDEYSCGAAEAQRLIDAGYAKPGPVQA